MTPNLDLLTQDTLHLLAFLLTGASGLYHEPPDYGSMRLLDAAGRLLGLLENQAPLSPSLAELKARLDAERAGSMDPDRYRRTLEDAVLRIAAELRQTLD